jgi:hypothetical protein
MVTIASSVRPIVEPEQEGEDVKVITTLGYYEGRTYFSVPDGLDISDQSKDVDYREHTLNEISGFVDELEVLKEIKNTTIENIKQKYSIEDELCSLRKEIETLKKGLMKMGKQFGVKASKKDAKFLTEEHDTEHGVFVKECVDKGRKRKQELGLTT